MRQLIKSSRYLTNWLTLLVLLVFVISCASCEDGHDRWEKFLAEQEQEYLEQVADVFKEHERMGYSSTGMEHVEFFRKMSAIKPPSHLKGRHDNLKDLHVLNADVKLYIERLEPWEQEQWRRQGYDDVARCSRVIEDPYTPASPEYTFACSVLEKAREILSHEISRWKIDVLQVYEGDPYDLGN